MTIIAVANQKGGVGKTTTAVNLAHGAALRGLNVLLIDLDSQGNVADSLGIDSGPDLHAWLSQELPVESVAIKTRPNLSVIRADKTTAALKNILAATEWREYALANHLDSYPYDWIVIDCAPSVDVLHTAALVASDYLLIPTRLDQFAIKGVVEVVRSLSSVVRVSTSNCTLAGIVPTFFDRQTTETQEQLTNLVNCYKGDVMPVIPQDVACRRSNRAGQTLWEYAPHCRALVGNCTGPGVRYGGYCEVLDRLMSLP